MQGKIKDARVYFRVRTFCASAIYAARGNGKGENQKSVRHYSSKGSVIVMRKTTVALAMMLLFILWLPLSAFAGVTLIWLDTSGSMNKEGRFESAKEVLIREIDDAKPGDVMYIGSFDSNDHIIGRLAVDETGSREDKKKFIDAVRSLSAKGLWTNIDEPLKASKAIMYDERAPGKIVILSDGLSDPSPDHQPVDLGKIAEIVPQSLGWSLYLIGLSQDIEGLFQTKSPEAVLTVNQEYPHIKGIALNELTRAKIEEAVHTVKGNEAKTVENSRREAVPAPWPAVLTASFIGAVSVPLLLVHRHRRKKLVLIFEARGTDGESKELQVVFEDGVKKSVGPKGDIVVESDNMEFPPILFSIQWTKDTLWLLPQDSISINGKLANDKVAISIGDSIKARDRVLIVIKEGGRDVTE